MNLLILNGARDRRPGKNPRYRGTYRAHPLYCDELGPTSEINTLFMWFLEEGGELGVVHTLSKARRLAELWNVRSANTFFEVVEVSDRAFSEATGVRLGFDLSAGYNNSLLTTGLARFVLPAGMIEKSMETAWDQLTRRFAPLLNDKGLFENAAVAQECLVAMEAIQSLSPNFFEGGNNLDCFQPVAIRLITD